MSLHASGVSLIKLLPWRELVCSLLVHGLLLVACSPEPVVPSGGLPMRMDARLVAANSPGREAAFAERLGPVVPSGAFSGKPSYVSGRPEMKTSDGGQGLVAETSVMAQSSSAEVSRRYLPTRRLDARPVVVEDVPRTLPPVLSSASPVSQGGAMLVLWVNEMGRVDRVEVKSSTLPDEVVTGFVEDFKRVRFEPARSEGLPTGFFMRIRVRMEAPDGFGADAAQKENFVSGEFAR